MTKGASDIIIHPPSCYKLCIQLPSIWKVWYWLLAVANHWSDLPNLHIQATSFLHCYFCFTSNIWLELSFCINFQFYHLLWDQWNLSLDKWNYEIIIMKKAEFLRPNFNVALVLPKIVFETNLHIRQSSWLPSKNDLKTPLTKLYVVQPQIITKMYPMKPMTLASTSIQNL